MKFEDLMPLRRLFVLLEIEFSVCHCSLFHADSLLSNFRDRTETGIEFLSFIFILGKFQKLSSREEFISNFMYLNYSDQEGFHSSGERSNLHWD
jgi:hypothetical protein